MRPTLLLALLPLTACDCGKDPVETGDSPEDTDADADTDTDADSDTDADTDTDTGPLPLTCVTEDPPDGLGLPDTYWEDDTLSMRFVEVPSEHFASFWLAMFFPRDKAIMAYEEGLPTVVVAIPSLVSSQAKLEARIPSSYGILEIQPVYPGMRVPGLSTSGDLDQGGEQSAWALVEATRFAAGQLRDVDGNSVAQLAMRPVCNERVVMLGTSSGSPVAAQALLRGADTLPEIVFGFGNHEPPSVPQFVAGDLGWVWMDSDDRTDADGDGYPWDDARNLEYAAGACPPDQAWCDVPYTDLAWTTERTLSEIDPVHYYAAPGDEGILYLDRNANGQFDYVGQGDPDVDRNGAIDADEDFLFGPQQDPLCPAPLNLHFYSEELLAQAVAQGALSLSDWPSGLADPTQAAEFWAIRNNMLLQPQIADAYAGHDLRVYLEFRSKDHAVAQPSRPHLQQLYEAWRGAGVPTRYNGDAALFDCLFGTTGWTGELPVGAEVPEGDLNDHALPDVIGNEEARVMPALSLYWDVYGPFDHCPGMAK